MSGSAHEGFRELRSVIRFSEDASRCWATFQGLHSYGKLELLVSERKVLTEACPKPLNPKLIVSIWGGSKGR